MRAIPGSLAACALAVTLISATAAPAAARTYRVTIHLRAAVDVGHAVHVAGTVPRRGVGQRVRLQQATANGWLNRRSAIVDEHSRFDIAFKPRRAGVYTFRVAWGYVASHRTTIRVYRWHYISDMKPRTAIGLSEGSGPETINSVTYPHSYVWAVSSTYDASTFAWSLYGKCTNFRGVFGYSNESSHDASAETIISVDRRPSLYDDTSTFGESASLTRSINGAQRLRFESKWIDGDGGYTLGNVQIRCAW